MSTLNIPLFSRRYKNIQINKILHSTHPNSSDEFNFGNFFQFSLDLHLSISFEIKRFVDNSLSKEVFHMLLVFFTSHVDSVLILTNDISITIYLKTREKETLFKF